MAIRITEQQLREKVRRMLREAIEEYSPETLGAAMMKATKYSKDTNRTEAERERYRRMSGRFADGAIRREKQLHPEVTYMDINHDGRNFGATAEYPVVGTYSDKRGHYYQAAGGPNGDFEQYVSKKYTPYGLEDDALSPTVALRALNDKQLRTDDKFIKRMKGYKEKMDNYKKQLDGND